MVGIEVMQPTITITIGKVLVPLTLSPLVVPFPIPTMLLPLFNDALSPRSADSGRCAGSHFNLDTVLVVVVGTAIGELESSGEVLEVPTFVIRYGMYVGGPNTVGARVVVEIMVAVLTARGGARVEVLELVDDPYNFPTGTSPVALFAIPIFGGFDGFVG
jgi:hypothetical protein